jgi:integrase
VKHRLVDTKTRYQGVFARHQAKCGLGEGKKRCNCRPRYYGVIWDRSVGKPLKTGRFDQVIEARDARADLLESLRRGTISARSYGATLEEIKTRFLQGARNGVVLNKHGRKYRKRAIKELESALKHLPDSLLRTPADKVLQGDIQNLADSLADRDRPLSGSRIREVVYGVSTLYQFAHPRELAKKDHNPKEGVRLPAPDETIRDFVVEASTFVLMLKGLEEPTKGEREKGNIRTKRQALRDQVPYALAAYGTARAQEIRILDWSDVYFGVRALELAADEEGRKPGGSWRIVPMVEPLLKILLEEWEAQGQPNEGRVCRPRKGSKSGLVSMDNIQDRSHRRWLDLGIKPILFQEARHTAATWMDHARVPRKVASEIMGHKTPTYALGAARITLQRYTHMLPSELERARERLDAYLREMTPLAAPDER